MSPCRWLTLVSRACLLPHPCSRLLRTGWVQAFSLIFALATFTLPASAEWKEKVLYSFQGGSDGAVPAGGVAFDKAGNLYGATTYTPSCDDTFTCGTAFQLSLQGGTWVETTLHAFQGHAQGDGGAPGGGVILDASGNVYGTTGYGGTGGCTLAGTAVGCGTVYELSPPTQQGSQWTYTILYNFQGGNDGQFPWGDLVFDKKGNLYGATQFGGGKGTTCDPFYQYCGTVFELRPPKKKGGTWKEKVLYSFKGVDSGKQYGDGANPNGGLVLDAHGAIYGTTYFGGNNVKGECQGGVGGTGCGIVFELTPPSQQSRKWREKVLHQFNGKDGSNPAAGVIFDQQGNLYGTTPFGPGPYGLVFELAKPSGEVSAWTEAVLHFFTDGNDGAYPSAGLAFDDSGDLYGTALGGAVPRGVVFRLRPPRAEGKSWPFTTLYNLTGAPDGNHPTAGVVFDTSGNLLSTTEWGGSGQACQGGCGTVFSVKY